MKHSSAPTSPELIKPDVDIDQSSVETPAINHSQVVEVITEALQHLSLHTNNNIPTAPQVSVKIVDEDEMIELNGAFRDKHKVTNILSFPADIPAELNLPLLGDLAICAPVVKQEAETQHKSELAHWTHLLVHGTLHLLNYDHITDEEADEMETLEIQILNNLGYANPYL